MPAHRACVGCGAPAAYGSWCIPCSEEREGVNLVNFGESGVPWDRQAARDVLDAAVARALDT